MSARDPLGQHAMSLDVIRGLHARYAQLKTEYHNQVTAALELQQQLEQYREGQQRRERPDLTALQAALQRHADDHWQALQQSVVEPLLALQQRIEAEQAKEAGALERRVGERLDSAAAELQRHADGHWQTLQQRIKAEQANEAGALERRVGERLDAAAAELQIKHADLLKLLSSFSSDLALSRLAELEQKMHTIERSLAAVPAQVEESAKDMGVKLGQVEESLNSMGHEAERQSRILVKLTKDMGEQAEVLGNTWLQEFQNRINACEAQNKACQTQIGACELQCGELRSKIGAFEAQSKVYGSKFDAWETQNAEFQSQFDALKLREPRPCETSSSPAASEQSKAPSAAVKKAISDEANKLRTRLEKTVASNKDELQCKINQVEKSQKKLSDDVARETAERVQKLIRGSDERILNKAKAQVEEKLKKTFDERLTKIDEAYQKKIDAYEARLAALESGLLSGGHGGNMSSPSSPVEQHPHQRQGQTSRRTRRIQDLLANHAGGSASNNEQSLDERVDTLTSDVSRLYDVVGGLNEDMHEVYDTLM